MRQPNSVLMRVCVCVSESLTSRENYFIYMREIFASKVLKCYQPGANVYFLRIFTLLLQTLKSVLVNKDLLF